MDQTFTYSAARSRGAALEAAARCAAAGDAYSGEHYGTLHLYQRDAVQLGDIVLPLRLLPLKISVALPRREIEFLLMRSAPVAGARKIRLFSGARCSTPAANNLEINSVTRQRCEARPYHGGREAG